MDSFQEMLERWGFRPTTEAGHPKADSEPRPQKQPDEKVKEIAQKILSTPDVKL